MIHLVRRRPRLEREGDGTVEFGIGKAFCALLRRVWTRLESLLNCFPFERNQLRCEIVDVLERTGVRTWRSVIMVRNKPAGDAFASNRRSPALVRRKRELELKAEQEGNELATGVRRSLPSASRIADESMSGPAEVSVRRKDGYFEVKGNISMAGDPDVTYDILADHENNPHIFKTLSKVEVEYKDDMKLVTQHAHWNLMFWSGNFDIKLKVEEDRSKRVIAFELTEPGFLKLFSGQWGIEPWIQEGKQVGSKVMVTQEVLPSILPPGPLGGYVSRIMGNQVKAALQDLSAEAERLQQCKRSNAK